LSEKFIPQRKTFKSVTHIFSFFDMSYSLNRNATVFYFINIFLFLFIILIFLLALFLRLPNFISSFYSYCVHLVLLSSPLLCFFRSYSFNICSWFYFFTASIHLSSLSYSKKIVLKYFLSIPHYFTSSNSSYVFVFVLY
jgi:hypothetical protein